MSVVSMKKGVYPLALFLLTPLLSAQEDLVVLLVDPLTLLPLVEFDQQEAQ